MSCEKLLLLGALVSRGCKGKDATPAWLWERKHCKAPRGLKEIKEDGERGKNGIKEKKSQAWGGFLCSPR